MRNFARIAGLAWLGLTAMAGAILLATQTMVHAGAAGSSRGLIYIVFGSALPGVLLHRWGRGPYQRPAPTRELVAKAYPAKTAGEMGHVLRVNLPEDSHGAGEKF